MVQTSTLAATNGAAAIPVEAAIPSSRALDVSRAILPVAGLALLAILAPLWTLLVAPLVLGVPHVACDVRWLWLRLPGGLSRAVAMAIALPLVLLLARRALLAAGIDVGPSDARTMEIALGIGAIAGAALCTPSDPRRRAIVLPLLAVLACLTLAWPANAMLVLGHMHNAVALGFVCLFTAATWSRLRRSTLVLGAFVVALLLTSDLALRIAQGSWIDRFVPAGFEWDGIVRALAPGLSTDLGARLVLVFAFAQALHYFAWIHVVPAAGGANRKPATGRIEAARTDFGSIGLAAIVVVALLVPVLGFRDPLNTRATYLSLVFFHGWLELAIAAHLMLRPTGFGGAAAAQRG